MALKILRDVSPTHPDLAAQRIGVVQQATHPNPFGFSQGLVKLNHAIGGTRILDYRSGEQLPRIC